MRKPNTQALAATTGLVHPAWVSMWAAGSEAKEVLHRALAEAYQLGQTQLQGPPPASSTS